MSATLAPRAALAALDVARASPERVFGARGLTKIYQTGDVAVEALRALDLDLYRGELLVLLGASGSGKSTLLNILGGLDTATSGNVRFEEHDLTAMTEKELTRYRREHVGFVFQFYNLIPSLTARENVALVTAQRAVWSGLEMVAVGSLAAGAAYGIGRLVTRFA